ncbi:hypothetical protein CROQUDRAFT_723669 [Cronartium quercuum f. sp. fusiforme G11]|uniref:Uncharacterized protein n=1 Tax=Cronartium quercuum f. sp. fusiforme G11 TaxID=708437 RepID=A0A9P6NFI1_9BASI|nr:hypothetical protein CROQUDRAFT_723669 [Cronartium quercuum f. sp. fusiforme G11]
MELDASNLRMIQKLSRIKKVDKKCSTQKPTCPGTHNNRTSGHDVHFNQQASSQQEFLTYIAKKILDPTTQSTPTSPTVNEPNLEKGDLLKPENQSDRLSPTTSPKRSSSQSSCSSRSLKNSSRPSTSSRRLSIYFLPPDRLDLEELTTHNEGDGPCYISRSPVSQSEMEFFSFPPSSRSHDHHCTSPTQLKDIQEFPADCSTTAYQANVPPEISSQSPASGVKSCKATSSLDIASRQCAHHYLQLGIKAHEEDDLKRSASLFRMSATEAGGCGLGMLMWALTLRHGWGCEVDTEKAYWWLRLSAETLVNDLENLKIEMSDMNLVLTVDQSVNSGEGDGHEKSIEILVKECKAITSEVLLALYELGQCLMRGWGCERDKVLAVKYFTLAANLGDPDAQLELAYCYEKGKGVGRSLNQAATYYRMAFTQGVRMMGYQWIWKEKELRDPDMDSFTIISMANLKPFSENQHKKHWGRSNGPEQSQITKSKSGSNYTFDQACHFFEKDTESLRSLTTIISIYT